MADIAHGAEKLRAQAVFMGPRIPLQISVFKLIVFPSTTDVFVLLHSFLPSCSVDMGGGRETLHLIT